MKKLLVLITITVLFLAFSQQQTHAATCDTITWNTPTENTSNIFTLSGTIANCQGPRRVRIKIQYQRIDNSDQPTSLTTEPITITDGKLTTDVPFTYPVTIILTLYDVDNTDAVIVNPNCNTVPDNLKNNSKCNWVYYTSVTPGKTSPGTTPPTGPAITCNTSFSYTGDQSLLVCPKDCPSLINLQGTNYQCSTQNLTNLPLATTDLRISLRPKSDAKDTYIVNQAYATYIGQGDGSSPTSTGTTNGGTDFESIMKGQGQNISLFNSASQFADQAIKNVGTRFVNQSTSSFSNPNDARPYLIKIYNVAVANSVNPAIVLTIWGVEDSFTFLNDTEFGCKPFGSGFDKQLDCSVVGTLSFWMNDFNKKKAQGIFPVQRTGPKGTCNFDDPFLYAYEAYTPVCTQDDGNSASHDNFVTIYKEIMGIK